MADFVICRSTVFMTPEFSEQVLYRAHALLDFSFVQLLVQLFSWNALWSNVSVTLVKAAEPHPAHRR
jgi:hypothetical protein